MFCSNCGKQIEAEANFCEYCGAKIIQGQSEGESGATLQVNSDEYIEETNTIEDDMQIFVGKNSQYYNYKWKSIDESSNGVSWNFASFFLSTFWLGYRKMYKEVFIIAIIFLLFDFVLYLLDYQYSTDSFIDPLDQAVSVGVAVVLGMLGNKFYRSHVTQKVVQIRSRQATEEEKQVMLRMSGGTSGLGVFLSILIMIGVYIIPSLFIPNNIAAIEEIKSGSFYDYPDQTIGETFNAVFDHGEWEKTSNNSAAFTIIEYTGVATEGAYQYDVRILFLTDTDSDEFEVQRIFIDGTELNEYEILEFLEYIFKEYETNSGNFW